MMLTGKVALVTGAGRGLGKAIALRLGREGAKVAVNDLNPENAETTAAEIVTAGGEAGAWVADVGGKRPIQNMIDEVQERWGRIDILINTARVEPRASIMRMDEWDWERTIGVNLKGTFLMCQSVGRVMKESGGAIVNVVSDTADGSDRAAYLASQIGLIGFTHACAHEFAPFNIRVNAICRTLNVAGSLRDYAAPFEAASSDPVELAVFLCSDAAAAIHGRVIATHFESEKETS